MWRGLSFKIWTLGVGGQEDVYAKMKGNSDKDFHENVLFNTMCFVPLKEDFVKMHPCWFFFIVVYTVNNSVMCS